MDGKGAATGQRGSGDPRRPLPARPALFDRIVCGIDGTDEAILAARQAQRMAPGTPTVLVHVIDVLDAVQHRRDYPAWIHAMRDTGRLLLGEARRKLEYEGGPALQVTVEEGDIAEALRYAAGPGPRTLIAVGSGDETDRRLRSSGPPPTGVRLCLRVVEAVPCTVLVARRPSQAGRFPRSITVGVDGSGPSIYAYDLAERIAAGTGAELAVTVALGGKGADLRALREAEPPVGISAVTEDKPVKALLEAGAHSDLIVVGNRGLHGLRGLGSVSNRIVTNCPSSVLVVRGAVNPGDRY